MAKILCSYSGVLFQCEHMPISLSAREYYHPLFSIHKKKLLTLAKDWANNKLTPTESYLLYLSLFHSTDLIIWRSPARFTDKTMQIISNNMEHLIQIIGKIDVIKHPNFVLPQFAISYDTASLENSFYWIQAWMHKYNEFMEGFLESQKREEIKEKVDRREHSLERLIKTAYASPQSVANNLSDWAALSGGFPDFMMEHPLTRTKVNVTEYWQEIIKACVKEESIWRYPKADIVELVEHCEENIEHGSIYANSLMKLLRTGLQKHSDYTGFGDVDLAGRTTSFKLLPQSASAEDANVYSAIQSAPENEPKRHQYPSAGAYLRAKLNWDLKQRYGKDAHGSNGESK